MTSLTEPLQDRPLQPPAQAEGAMSSMRASSERFHDDVHCVLGLPFDAVNMAQAVERVRAAALANRRCFVSTPNLNFLVAARSDPAFRDSVLRSDLSLADGMPIIWVAHLLGVPLPERVAGAGLFERLCEHAGTPISAYFFGGPPGVAQAACERVNRSAQGLRCVGWQDPGFVPVEAMSDDARIETINRSGAQFVIAALGAKKGQAWLERNAARLRAPLLCHLGAVVNFAAGTVRRAPRWVQRLSLEWLWRIKEEPALWRRYGGDGLVFLGLLAMRVLPCAARTRWLRPRGAEAAATMQVDDVPPALTLRLGGAWTRESLAPLRAVLAAAASRRCTIALRLDQVSWVDSAFLGLLLVARGVFGSGLTIEGADRRLGRLFHRHGAEFLLGRTSPQCGP